LTATALNTKWITDITSILTAEYWLYLYVVLNYYSSLVMGWFPSAARLPADRPSGPHARTATLMPF